MLRNFQKFYQILKKPGFITVFRRARHCAVLGASNIHSIYSISSPMSFFHLYRDNRSDLIVFLPKPVCISLCYSHAIFPVQSVVFYMVSLISFGNEHKSSELLVALKYQAFHYFFPFKSQYHFQHPNLEHP